jgi:hypothetical protein
MWRSLVTTIVRIFIRHLPIPAQHMLAVESASFEVAGTAESNGSGVAEQLPLPQRRLDGKSWTCAVNGFAGNKPTVDEIESQCHESGDFGHNARLLSCSPIYLPG